MPTVKNFLAKQGLQLLVSFTQAQQEVCNTEKDHFEMLNNKFKPQYNETVKSWKFGKLPRQANQNVQECICTIRAVTIECNYKELDKKLNDQFINGLNDSDMLAAIIRELSKTDENMQVTSKQVLVWAKRIEAQRAQAAVINSLN